MKMSEISDMSREELGTKEKELKEALFNLRFQKEVGQLENPQKIKQTKRDIARVKTVINASAPGEPQP
jgi:large subunit ribosomal protein L29